MTKRPQRWPGADRADVAFVIWRGRLKISGIVVGQRACVRQTALPSELTYIRPKHHDYRGSPPATRLFFDALIMDDENSRRSRVKAAALQEDRPIS
jgi:hypothetical protein